MDTNTRRKQILEELKRAIAPLSATVLAHEYKVSRQVIVGDIAILKAQRETIMSSVKGYLYLHEEKDDAYTIVCRHDESATMEELQIIVDQGGIVKDVIVDHPLYGELKGNLDIHSRYDVDMFIQKARDTKARNLSEMNDYIHAHTIECVNQDMYERIKRILKERGFLYE